ncbi:MAG: protein kinase [Polyangiaceae bacterium]
MDLRPGVRLDRYTLVLRLGEGGQASVWKAIDPLDGGAVRALKVFALGGDDDPRTERARREAKASAGARHPGLLPCRGLVEDLSQGVVLLVFDFVRGRSLADALKDPQMTAEHRRCAVKQLAETLAYVHASGIVHRDIKPDNVLVTDAFWDAPGEVGTLKLVDFGIAAPVGNPHPLTQEGSVVGTAPYLPPELVDRSGAFPAGEDLQRDVFAFGVLAWEVLVGGHPSGLPLQASREAFAGVYLAALAKKRMWPPAAPPSPELAVVQTCLSLDASTRPASCVVVSEALPAGERIGKSSRTSEPVSMEEGQRRSQTEGHVSPTTAPMTREPVISASPRASGPPIDGGAMWTPPPLPVSGGDSMYGGQRESGRARQKNSTLVYVAAGASVLAVALVAYLVGRSNNDAPAPMVISPPVPQTVTPLTIHPRQTTDVPSPVPARTPVVCCLPNASTCESGRDCQPQPCSALVGDGPFRLRVIGGYLGTDPKDQVQFRGKSTRICVMNLRTGEEQCALSSTLYTQRYDAVNRTTATMADMIGGKIRMRIYNGSFLLYDGAAVANPTGYKATALCSNIVFHLGTWDSYAGKISVYLDDP